MTPAAVREASEALRAVLSEPTRAFLNSGDGSLDEEVSAANELVAQPAPEASAGASSGSPAAKRPRVS